MAKLGSGLVVLEEISTTNIHLLPTDKAEAYTASGRQQDYPET